MRNAIFNSRRLKKARLLRGLTITELAVQIDRSKQVLSKYEKGTKTPSFETLISIAHALKFPRTYFYQNDIEAISSETFFRSAITTPKKELTKMSYKLDLFIDLFRVLDDYITFPSLDLPEVKEYDSPEQAARELREYWGIGNLPIVNMVELIEAKGIITTSFPTNFRKVDAFSRSTMIGDTDRYFIVLGNDKQVAVRRNFDAAHEIGHRLLHANYVDFEELENEEYKEIEKEAHRFAAEFLLPEEAFRRDVVSPTDLAQYVDLKKYWNVSIQAMLMRAKNLKIITMDQYQNLYKRVSANGWRKSEPLDDMLPLPEPQLIRKSIDLLIGDSLNGKKHFMDALASNNLSLMREDVESTLGLPEGYLMPESGEVEPFVKKKMDLV